MYEKPAIKQLVQQKIKKYDTTQGAKMNWKQLIDSLDLTNLVNGKKENIEKSTLEDYARNIKLVYKHMFGKESDASEWEWVRDVPAVSRAIESMSTKIGNKATSRQTKTKRYTALLAFLERLDGFDNEAKGYRKLQNDSQKLVDSDRGENKLTERETKNWMNWPDIVNYKDKNWTDEDRLLHSLYTDIPPRRLEYRLLLLARQRTLPEALKLDKQYNYIVTNKSDTPTWIILNRYKTHKTYKTFEINLQETNSPYFNYKRLSKNIKTLLNSIQISTGKPMVHMEPFFPTTKEPKKGQINVYSGSNFGSSWLNHVFKNTGKNISVDILRHSFITNWLTRHPDAKDNVIEYVAKFMGHSHKMFTSYRKLNVEERIQKFIEEDGIDDEEE